MQKKRRFSLDGCLHPAFLPLALLLIYYLIRSVSAPYSDFAGYYFGGRELLAGRWMNAYDMEKLNSLILQGGYHGVFVSYAPFPPFTSLVFAPFLLLPMGAAKLVFNAFCCLLFLITLMRMRAFLDIPPLSILILPVVFYIPIVNNLFFGQSYLLLCCLLLQGYMAFKRDRLVLSSILWGVAVLFKIFPGVLLIWLLLKKRFRAAIGLCIACGTLLTLSLLINGWTVWKYYVLEILPKVNHGELNNSFTFMFQSAFMLLKRLFVYDALLNPAPLTDSPLVFGLLLAIFKALILAASIRYTVRKNHLDFDSLAVWITASMLISPNGSSYSLVLLMIPLLAVLSRRKPTNHRPIPSPPDAVNRRTVLSRRKPTNLRPIPSPPNAVNRRAVLSAALLLAACTIPVARLENAPVWEQFPRLYLLLIFFALLLQPLGYAWHPRLWAGLSVLFIALFLAGYHRDPDPSTYFFDREEHIFINNFSVTGGILTYSYRDETGPHPVSTGMPVTRYQALEIRNRQIYYRGKQLTNSPDMKKNPMLIDGKFILYLSDKNRGPGFYTLRKLIPS